jgi:hypothetical protein
MHVHRRPARMQVSGGRAALGAVAVTAMLALAACSGPPPWESPGATEPEGTAGASPSASPTVPAPVPNDLSSGSTERTLTAGPVTATVNYWSTLDMSQWTPGAIKPVSIGLSTTVVPNDGQKVFLQKATMIAVPADGSTTFDALSPQTDQSTVAPGYLVLDPYSYSQTFNVGAVPADAATVTLQFTYDFLVQTAPDANEYAKQTATDTVTVAIAHEASTD